MTTHVGTRIVVMVVLALAIAWASSPAPAQEPIKIKIQRLNFPSMVTMMTDIVKATGIDRKHGLDLEPKSYGAISAYYAALATGEVDIGVGGPHVLQKMRNEGVPIMAAFTYTKLSALGVVTGDPAIRSIADLKGKTIAADMGSSEFQILAIYGRNQGLVFGKDITVVQAGPPLARSQLQAKRIEAAMTWEPSLTLMLRDNAQYRVILTGDTAWNSITKSDGWQLVVILREDFVKRSPEAVPRLLEMFREGQELIRTNLDEADRIVQGTVKLPPGVFKESVTSGRLVYDVHPAWEPQHRQAIWDMFKVAVESKYLDRLPDENAIYTP